MRTIWSSIGWPAGRARPACRRPVTQATAAVGGHTALGHRHHAVAVQAARVEQLAQHEAGAARGLNWSSRRPCRSDRPAPAAAWRQTVRRSRSSRMTMPAERATATQWIRWSSPPVASSATIALTMQRSSTSSPIGGVARTALAEGQHVAHRLAGELLAQALMRMDEGWRPAHAGPSPPAASGWSWRCRRRRRCRRRGGGGFGLEQLVALRPGLCGELPAHLGSLAVDRLVDTGPAGTNTQGR